MFSAFLKYFSVSLFCLHVLPASSISVYSLRARLQSAPWAPHLLSISPAFSSGLWPRVATYPQDITKDHKLSKCLTVLLLFPPKPNFLSTPVNGLQTWASPFAPLCQSPSTPTSPQECAGNSSAIPPKLSTHGCLPQPSLSWPRPTSSLARASSLPASSSFQLHSHLL